jgi:hypothetical protein
MLLNNVILNWFLLGVCIGVVINLNKILDFIKEREG